MATGSRTPWVRQQFFDDNGDPLSGGLIDTYIAGSTTAVDTYTDITLTTTHTNPIVLNSRGETTIFLDPAVAYKFVLRNPLPDGSEIWTEDNITALGGGSLLTDLGVVRSKVVGSATLPVPLATNVVIPYDTADYEVNLTGFDGATNKWVCPLDGVYDLNAAVDFTIQSNAALPSATCEIFFLVNGVTAKNQKIWAFTTDANGGQKTLETSGTLQLSKNDEVQVIFVSPLQGSGTSIDLILINAFWDIISLSGVKGDQGDQGPAGPAGQGVPVGGTANQVLAKIDGTDYNTQWVNSSSNPSQGASGIINVADGAGAWLPMNGTAPLFVNFSYDQNTGILSFTGASLFTTENIKATGSIEIANDFGGLEFKSSNGLSSLADFDVQKDLYGPGLHQLDLASAHRFNVACEMSIQSVDPGTDTGRKMLVIDTNTFPNKIEQRPIPSGGAPSQGAQYIINISDGAGGWQALDGTSLPLFELNSGTGYLVFSGASGFITNVLEATDHVNISNDAGGLYFRDSSQSYLADFSIQKDLYGVGLHRLDLNGVKQFNIDSEVNFITFDPGTDTGKVMLVQDTNTNKVEQRPIPSGGGNPSQGSSGIINIADGAGGWLAMDGSARPLFEWSNTTGDLSFTGGNFFISETIQATDKFDVVDDSGEIRFRDSADTTTLARFYIQKDALGAGLHRLWLVGAEQFAVPIDVNLSADVTISNLIDPGTDTGKKMLVIDTTTKKVEERPIPSGGAPSQGVAGVLNISDGAGGWLAMDGSARPLLEWSSTTGDLSFTGGNFVITETFQATTKFDVANDIGQLRFRDTADTTTLARFRINKDALGAGLHELGLFEAKRFTIPNDFRVQGDVSFTGVVDPGTDTGKKMLVIDTTTKEIQERPIPSGGGTPAPMAVMVLKSNVDTDTFTKASPLLIPWNLEKYKDAGFSHSNTTNNTRAIVTSAGTYQISGRLRIFSPTAQRVQPTIKIYINGAVQNWSLDSGYIRNAGGSSDYWTLEFTYEPEKLSANDYLELELSLEAQNPGTYTGTLIGSESSFSVINLQGTQGIQGPAGPGGTDTNAVHVNVANEIAQITAKPAPLDPDDVLILEDSEDSYNKKSITIGDLPIPATSKKSEVVSYVKAGISNGANVAFTTRSAFTNPHFFTTNSGINWNIKKVSLNSAFGLFNVASFELVLEYVAVDTAWAIGSGTNLHSETFTSLTKNVPNNVISGSAITVAVPNNVNIFAYFKLNSGIYSITDAEIIVQLEEQ